MSLLPSRIALVVAAALLSLLAAATTASADLRIPTLGEATTLSQLPESVSWGSAMASDGNATFVAFSESEAGIMFQRIGAAGTEFSSQLKLQGQGTASIGAPVIATSGDHVYVAWLQAAYGVNEDHVALAASHDGGRTFSMPVLAGRPTGHGAWDVSIAADGENVFVAWSDDRDRLWTAGSRDAGRTFPCQAVITAPGMPTEGGYDIAVDGPRVHWVWLGDDFDAYTRRSEDGGRTLESVQHLRAGSPADHIGSPNVDADGGVVAITTSQMYKMPRPDRTGTDFGHQPVLTTSQDGGDTWAEQNIGTAGDRCIGDYCSAPYSLDVDGLDVYVAWRGQGSMWLSHSKDGGVAFDGAKRVGPYSYTWNTQQMPSLSARRDSVVLAWHSAPDPRAYGMDPIAAFSSDRGETFTLRTVDDAPTQDLMPAGVAWGPDPQGAGFSWMSFERSLLTGDRNVRFRPLSASEPDVAVLEVTPVQAAKDAARLAAGRATTIRVKLRSAAPARARVPLEIELAYDDEDGERVEDAIERDVLLRPGVSTVQLLADDPVVVGAGRITAKVKVSPDLYDSDHSNDEGEGSRAVVEPRPLTVLFVPVAASDEARPACADVQAVADGFEEHMLASWPVNPRYSHTLTDCSALMVHEPGLTDAGLMGARGLLARLDRLKWSGLMIDKVVGVTPRDWFSRQAMPGLAQAVGAAPLGGTLDAALVERQNTGGWVVAHELAHQLGWTEERGLHGNHLDEAPAPGYWVDERRDIPETTRDFMHFSTDGADVRKTTDRWISKATWDFLTTKLASPVMGATAEQGLAAAEQRTLSLTGTVKADGSVVAGDMAEVEGEPDAGEGEGPLTFEQLAADGSVLQTRRFGTSNDMGPIGGDSASGDEHAVTADAAFSLRVPAVEGARSLRIRRGADVLLQRTRPAAAPTVDVTAPAAGARIGIGADMTISWNAADADGDALTHFVALSSRRRPDLALARRLAHRKLAHGEGVARPRRQRRARARHDHRRLEHGHRRLRPVQHRRPAQRRQDRLQRLADRRRLDGRHRRRRREEDRRQRPPPALVARRHPHRLGPHAPLHGRRGGRRRPQGRRRPDRQQLLGPGLGRRGRPARQARERLPQGQPGRGRRHGRRHGLRDDLRIEVRRALRRLARRLEGPAPLRPLRGRLVDVHGRGRQDGRAARGQVVRLAVARRDQGRRHQVPQRQRLAHRRDRRRPQDRSPDQPHQRHVRRLQRLPRPGRRPASGSSGAPTRTAAARPGSARPTCGGSGPTARAPRRSSTASRSATRTSSSPTCSRCAASTQSPSRPARSASPMRAPAGRTPARRARR